MTDNRTTVSDHGGPQVPMWVEQAVLHGLLPSDVGAAISRLLIEFAGRLDGDIAAAAVLDAHRDLHDCPDSTRPELVERSARRRLLSGRVKHRAVLR
jgi:hypothetical protein